jgi:acyl-CoA reductase-like NAD-dependent aldehyde dehydrogenase
VARLPDFDSAVPLFNAHQYGNDSNIFTRSVTPRVSSAAASRSA